MESSRELEGGGKGFWGEKNVAPLSKQYTSRSDDCVGYMDVRLQDFMKIVSYFLGRTYLALSLSLSLSLSGIFALCTEHVFIPRDWDPGRTM